MSTVTLLRRLGIEETGGDLASIDPATGAEIARVRSSTVADYRAASARAAEAFRSWRTVPAPARGELVRRLGQSLRERKADLARLLSLEVGKVRSEAEGEVQEMIDMADLAVGLSRTIGGPTLASERPRHRMFEQWHPLGPVGVITAFNFPAAVWAWNAMVAAACGDPVIWKPSPLAPLTAMAVQRAADEVSAAMGHRDVFQLVVGGHEIGEAIAADPAVPLVSATGSTRMGRAVAEVVARRLGRSLLELGGNNAIIVSPKADLDLAIRVALFSAVGTAGQRCTTLRRLILHKSLADDGFLERLTRAYRGMRARIGDPWEPGTLVGPLISEGAAAAMMAALDAARAQGGEVLCGGRRVDRPGYFVEPALVRAGAGMPIVAEETFAPILYVLPYDDLDEAIAIQNSVDQGLSSAILTDSLREAERFLSHEGSDCGIANVNIGTSGAEIGGAFGGEKSTGGGREAGSDAWKSYMRRQTCTVNDGAQLPLAQGVRFEVEGSIGP